tara:strand:+ start:862 stop:2751 length:1890 start_codon:yes stop_codon:yes gene_type:complete
MDRTYSIDTNAYMKDGLSTATPESRPNVGSLAERAVELASNILRNMLITADDVLFSMAERSLSNDQQQTYFSAMRLLRKSGADISSEFSRCLAAQTVEPRKSAESVQELSLRDDEDVEIEISVTNIVSRVSGTAAQGIWEFGLRLECMADRALSERLENMRPVELVNAFRAAISTLILPIEVRLILMKLFERQLLAEAGNFYSGLNLKLERAGHCICETSRSETPDEPPAVLTPGSSPEHRTGHQTYSLPDTILSAVRTPEDHPGNNQTPSTGGLQRLSLVSQWIENLRMRVPLEDSAGMDRLLAPLVRIALSDTDFFTNDEHPAHAIINEMQGGSTDAASAADQVKKAGKALRDLAESTPVTAAHDVEALDARTLNKFLSSRKPTVVNAESRIQEARDYAHQRIKASGTGLDLPVGISSFLNTVWMPLATAVKLRFGEESREWRQAEDMMIRLFKDCRWINRPGQVASVLSEIAADMESIGLPKNLVDRAQVVLKAGLSAAKGTSAKLDLHSLGKRAETESRDSDEGTHSDQDTAALIIKAVGDWRESLPVGSWFRVFDRPHERTVWMSADVFYPKAMKLLFTGFDSSTRLEVAKPDFVRDLKAGRAEPVSPTPQQAAAIERLCATIH